jgi:phosphate acyltransferase
MTRLAIDGMGGDYAPRMVVDGLSLFHAQDPSVEFLLYGDEVSLKRSLDPYSSLRKVVEVVPTTEVVTSDMSVSQVLRGMRGESSMHCALKAVAEKLADGVVSAGNTGAYMALSRMILRTLRGIDRPAIVGCMPTQRGLSVMLDLGGTLQCDACHLVDYALMGEIFAKKILGIEKPSVGLLNVGVEHSKGGDTLKEASGVLQSLPIHFVGFIEGNDIPKGTVDVIVTDGFTGNTVLKSGEGILNLVFQSMRQQLASDWRGRLGYWIARKSFEQLKSQFDPRKHNGAIWLGLNGVAVKSHGGADALGFSSAISNTVKMINVSITEVLEECFSQYHTWINGERGL